jgi:hypothetical protein
MADNLTVTAGANATLVGTTPLATKQLDDSSHGGVAVIVDASGARAKTMAVSSTGAAKVEIERLSSASLANVTASASNVTLLASNSARRMAMIYNDSTSILYVKLGATASSTSYTIQMQPYAYYELPIPVYTGIIDGIWVAANGSARVTEI